MAQIDKDTLIKELNLQDKFKFLDCEKKIKSNNIIKYSQRLINKQETTDLDLILTEDEKNAATAIADRKKQADQDVLRSRMNYGSI